MGERETNINVWLPLTCPPLGTRPATQACALTGNRTGNPPVCRLELNPLSYTSQGSAVTFVAGDSSASLHEALARPWLQMSAIYMTSGACPMAPAFRQSVRLFRSLVKRNTEKEPEIC